MQDYEVLTAKARRLGLHDERLFVDWYYLAVLGLNRLAGCCTRISGKKLNTAQAAVLERIVQKVGRWCTTARACHPPSGSVALAELIADNEALGRAVNPPLVASHCDLLARSGLVDPMPDIDDDSRAILRDPGKLFTSAAAGLGTIPRIRRGDLHEYCKLVVLQLRSRKVQLSTIAYSGAGVFTVGKKSGRCREVWNGRDLSIASARPPVPPLLASPTALAHIETTPSTRLFVSKRDMRAYFDQLALLEQLRPYFGRPPVRLRDILAYGETCEEELFGLDPALAICDRSTLLYPLCTTWPMGYAWSSFIAQSVLLKRCEEAGLDRSIAIADTAPLPDDFSRCFALATDDLMLFSVAEEGAVHPSSAALKMFDDVILRHGLIPASEKNVNDEASATCIGIDIDSGRYLTPHSHKAALLVEAVSFMCRGMLDVDDPRDDCELPGADAVALGRQRSDGHDPGGDRELPGLDSSLHVFLSDLELAALLGQCTWFGIMNRPSLSVFDSIYEITKGGGAERTEVPRAVVRELAHFVALLPLLEADLQRPWQRCLVATDASVNYGFGVSVADVSQEVVRNLGRVAAAPGHLVRLARGGGHPDDEDERPRTGVVHNVGLTKWDFRSVISCKRHFDAHSGGLEAHGVGLGLRWLLRSATRHGRRTTLLIDAQSVLGAVRKGRSSAPSLKREIRFIGGLILAGDLLVRCLYIPSEDNPADAPSRGIVRKHVLKKSKCHSGKRQRESALEHHRRIFKPFLDKIDSLPSDHPVQEELRRLQSGV